MSEKTESNDKEYRLQQFLKWEGGLWVLYYALTSEERAKIFDRLQKRIEDWERDQQEEKA